MEHLTETAPVEQEPLKQGQPLQADPGPGQSEEAIAAAALPEEAEAAPGGPALAERLERVAALLAEGRTDLAEALCREAPAHRSSPDLLHLLAVAVSRQGRVAEAEGLLREAVAL